VAENVTEQSRASLVDRVRRRHGRAVDAALLAEQRLDQYRLAGLGQAVEDVGDLFGARNADDVRRQRRDAERSGLQTTADQRERPRPTRRLEIEIALLQLGQVDPLLVEPLQQFGERQRTIDQAIALVLGLGLLGHTRADEHNSRILTQHLLELSGVCDHRRDDRHEVPDEVRAISLHVVHDRRTRGGDAGPVTVLPRIPGRLLSDVIGADRRLGDVGEAQLPKGRGQPSGLPLAEDRRKRRGQTGRHRPRPPPRPTLRTPHQHPPLTPRPQTRPLTLAARNTSSPW